MNLPGEIINFVIASDGGRSSDGRAPDCDSGCRGFDPRRSPQLFMEYLGAVSSVGRAVDS